MTFIDTLVVSKGGVPSEEQFSGFECRDGTVFVWVPEFYSYPNPSAIPLEPEIYLDEPAGEIVFTRADTQAEIRHTWFPSPDYDGLTVRLTRPLMAFPVYDGDVLVNYRFRLAVWREQPVRYGMKKVVPMAEVGGFRFYHVRFATRAQAQVWDTWVKANVHQHAGIIGVYDSTSSPDKPQMEQTTVRDFLGEPAWSNRKLAAYNYYNLQVPGISAAELNAIQDAANDRQFILALMQPLAPDDWTTQQLEQAFWRRW